MQDLKKELEIAVLFWADGDPNQMLATPVVLTQPSVY